MIIHIAGPSGSGKTTLGNKINKNNKCIIVDTDDIDDHNFNRLLKSNIEFRKSIMGTTNRKWSTILDNKNLEKLNKIIQIAKKQNKVLIITGISFAFSKADPSKIADKKYFINIDNETLFRRVNLRMLDDIIKNKSKIKNLFKNEKTNMLNIITHKLSHQFNLRGPFIESYYMIVEDNNKKQKEYKQNNYKILTPEQIYKSVMKLISME